MKRSQQNMIKRVSMTVRTMVMTVILLCSAAMASADTSTRLFRNYSAADGLADNSAQIIACTKTGRLVIATMGQINF